MDVSSSRGALWTSLLLFSLCAIFSSRVAAADNTEAFQAKLKAGSEVGMVLDKTKSRDGQVGIIYAARKKTMKPANWPVLMTDFHYVGTVAEGTGDGFLSENWIVSLAEQKRLAVVKWSDGEVSTFHPDDHRSDLSATWTPNADGARLGLMVFSSDGKSYGVELASLDRGAVKTTDLLKSFDRAANDFTTRQKTWRKGKTYQILYHTSGAGLEERALPRGGTAFYQIGFTASVDKDRASTPPIHGTIHLRVTSKPAGGLDTEIVRVSLPGVKVDYGPVPPPLSPVPVAVSGKGAATPAVPSTPSTPIIGSVSTKAPVTVDEFTDFRLSCNKISDGKQWKLVRKELPVKTKGQRHYVVGWMEGTDLKMMMHVDGATKDDVLTTFYYYYQGALTSVYERRKGAATQISEVSDASETYNFIEEKLVGWKRTPVEGGGDGFVSPSDSEFGAQGKQVLKTAIALAQPIFQAIKAD